MKTQSIQSTIQNIGNKLEVLRIKKGYTSAEEFAHRHGLPVTLYTNMEKGTTNVTVKALLKVLKIHQMTPEDFFCDDKITSAAA